MPSPTPRTPPLYAVTSVDNALKIAILLQLEGRHTVAQVADRLKVSRSTAHRLLAMLVYRGFAAQDDDRRYRAGPVLELDAETPTNSSRLRNIALPHLERLVVAVRESANLAIRTGRTARFIASVECDQVLRVGSREGIALRAHETTGGLLLLAELEPEQLYRLYDRAPDGEVALARLLPQLERIKKAGHVVNDGLSEPGVVAVGVPLRDGGGRAIAGLAVSIPSVRYQSGSLPGLVTILSTTADAIAADLRGEGVETDRTGAAPVVGT